MINLINLLKTAQTIAVVSGLFITLTAYLKSGFAAALMCFGIFLYLIAWLHEYIKRERYNYILKQYQNAVLPIFVIQDPITRNEDVWIQAQKIRQALIESNNKVLSSEHDVHEIYYQDPRFNGVESPIEYEKRVIEMQKETIKRFKEDYAKREGSYVWMQQHFFGQNLTPPEPIRKRFNLN